MIFQLLWHLSGEWIIGQEQQQGEWVGDYTRGYWGRKKWIDIFNIKFCDEFGQNKIWKVKIGEITGLGLGARVTF